MRRSAMLMASVLASSAAAVTAAAQTPADEPFAPSARWREFVVGGEQPPAVTQGSPLIATVDARPDLGHPAFAAGNVETLEPGPVTNVFGTAVAAAIAGMTGEFRGVWPGARVLNVPFADAEQIRCSDSARGIDRAVAAGADVIFMGYGSRSRCAAEQDAILRAVREGVIPVAAGRMRPDPASEQGTGSGPAFPADLPHVLTAGAVTVDSSPAAFSIASPALDVSAPGTGVFTAVPVALDANRDGYSLISGTGMPAAMVAAVAAWVRAARPELTPGQVAAAIRLGARDVGEPGRDPAAGYGILSVSGALRAPVPPGDPAEPNDDIRLVDGRLFGRATPPLRTSRRPAITGTIDRAEDPADVHRVKLQGAGLLRVRLAALHGDPDLYVMSHRAKGIADRERVLGRSRQGPGADEVVTVRTTRRPTIYVVVRFSSTKPPVAPDAGYSLSILRR